MRYATPETVYRLLEIDPNTTDTQLLDILDDIEEGIAQAIDLYTGRTFGTAPLYQTRDIAYRAGSAYPSFYTDRVYIPESGLYFFTESLVSIDGSFVQPYVSTVAMDGVTTVAVNGSWNGFAWDDQEILDPSDYRLVFRTNTGWYHGIQLPAFGYSSVRVTADWEDLSPSTTIPPIIREAATELVVDEYRIRTQSPTGELGPPGLITYVRNIWEHTPVKMALDGMKVQKVVV